MSNNDLSDLYRVLHETNNCGNVEEMNYLLDLFKNTLNVEVDDFVEESNELHSIEEIQYPPRQRKSLFKTLAAFYVNLDPVWSENEPFKTSLTLSNTQIKFDLNISKKGKKVRFDHSFQNLNKSRVQLGFQIISRDKNQAKTFFIDSQYNEIEPSSAVKYDDEFEEIFITFSDPKRAQNPKIQIIVFHIGSELESVPSRDFNDQMKFLLIQKNDLKLQIRKKMQKYNKEFHVGEKYSKMELENRDNIQKIQTYNYGNARATIPLPVESLNNDETGEIFQDFQEEVIPEQMPKKSLIPSRFRK